MQLDVVMPTYNRAELLERALISLLAATPPDGLDVRITVVDNNSKDNTRALIERYIPTFEGRLSYLFAATPGRSHALNAGIATTKGDLVATIDDDEEIHPDWYRVIFSHLGAGELDFIGGPCLPRWGGDPPEWLPDDYNRGVLGWIEGPGVAQTFGEDYEGMLMGGNAAFTRAILEKVGPYHTGLGRAGSALLSCEDEDMYGRLLGVGARGKFIPELIIYHWVPPERLTKRYYRRWCFWHAVSAGVLDRDRPKQVAYLAGVPRYFFGDVARGVGRIARSTLRRSERDAARAFSSELTVWNLAGYLYGKHFR